MERLQDLFFGRSEKYSGNFGLNFDPSTEFAFYLNPNVPIIGDAEPCGIILRSFDKRREFIKATVKLWFEGEKGHQLVEHLCKFILSTRNLIIPYLSVPDIKFKEVGDKCGFALPVEPDEEATFFNDHFKINGSLYLCVELRYNIPENGPETKVKTETMIPDIVVQVGGKKFKVGVLNNQNSISILGRKENDDFGVSVLQWAPLGPKCKDNSNGQCYRWGCRSDDQVDSSQKYQEAYYSVGGVVHCRRPVQDRGFEGCLFVWAHPPFFWFQHACLEAMSINLNKDNIFARTMLAFKYQKEVPCLKREALAFVTQKPRAEYLTPLFCSTDWLDLIKANQKLAEEIMNTVFSGIWHV